MTSSRYEIIGKEYPRKDAGSFRRDDGFGGSVARIEPRSASFDVSEVSE